MSFLRLHKLVTYLVASMGLYALTLGFEIGPVRSALFALGLFASVFAEGDLVRRPRWGRAWTQLVVAAFIVQIARALTGTRVLELAVEYAAFLQISRLFNRKDGKDHQQIAVLAFLHLVAATVLTTDVGYAFVFLGFVVAIPWMLALSHLRREIEEHYPAPAPAPATRRGAGSDRPPGQDDEGTDVRRVLRSRRLIGAPFLLGTAFLVLPLVAFTTVLFLAFPRVGLGVFSFGQQGGQRVVGFGRDVRLGGFGLLRSDPTVVMRVTLPDRVPEHLVPLRLRGTSFDRYDGRRWSRSDTGHERMSRMGPAYFPVVRWSKPQDIDVAIALERLDDPVVFLPPSTVGLEVRPRQRRGLDVPRRLLQGPGLDIRYGDADDLGLRYTAVVSAEPRPIGAGRRLTAEERSRYTQLPDGPSGPAGPVAQLARRVVGDAETVGERVERLRRFLFEEGGYVYSLSLPQIPSGADPLAHFLLESKQGHCEYFSTALAIMLRTQGIPSRNVTGFLGGQSNEFGNYTAVRQADAHSWVEAWIPGEGWRTLDPTPVGRDAAGPRPSPLDGARAFFDALRARWVGYVVTYDLQTQLEGLSSAYDFFARLRGRAAGDPLAFSERGPGGARTGGGDIGGWGLAAGAAVGGFVVALLAGRWWWRRRRRRRGGGDPGARMDRELRRVVDAYRAADRLVARAGRPRPADRTPRAHADHLAAQGVPGSDEVGRITATYLEARYAGRSPSPDALARLDADLARLRAILARTHGHQPVRAR